MKRFLQIFELSKNEQRVVLIVILILLTIAFVEYERRVYRIPAPTRLSKEPQSSPSPVGIKGE